MPPTKQTTDPRAYLLQAFKAIVTRAEFTKSFQNVVNLVLKAEQALVKRINEQTANALETLNTKIDAKLATIKDGKDGATGPRGLQGIQGPPGNDGQSIVGPPGPPGRDGIDGKNGKDAQIDLSVIEELREELNSLEQKLSGRIDRIPKPRLGMRKVPIIRSIDLSSSCDGATKSFTLPRDTVRVLAVAGTQFPITFRADVDWTLTGQTLTLADPISAPNSGETLYAIIETLFYA